MTLSDHTGRWQGTWSTWLQPGVLHDESPLSLTVSRDGDSWLLDYAGEIAGDAVTGSMQVITVGDRTEVTWTDTWHTAGASERLVGTDGKPASYTYGEPGEPWTWSIEITPEPDRLVITHYNAPPGADPAMAVLMDLTPR